jgi:transposase
LRLRFEQRLGLRAIAAAVSQSRGWVANTLSRVAAADLARWPLPAAITDEEIERRIFGVPSSDADGEFVPIDLEHVHRERRRVGVTLELLWHEYAEYAGRGDGKRRAYSYSRFCELYARYRDALSPSMRQVHVAGEKMFIDYSGKRPSIVDALSGEVTDVELYVAVLGGSSLTYAEVTRTQRVTDFVSATVRALEYFGGAPRMLVPDQLRSAVSEPARHMPEINAVFGRMAAHYQCAVVPARPHRPRDKAKVEVAVQVVQRWIVARLRNQRFFNLGDLNRAIRALLEELNHKPMRKLGASRRELFEQHERPALRPLPSTRFEPIECRFNVGVGIDYCIEFDRRYYSVPRTLVGRRVDVYASASTIEILRAGVRVASHPRSHGRLGTATIDPQHRPPSHREYGEWPPERLEAWARKYGDAVYDVVSHQLRSEEHPELRYRVCLAILSLAKQYGADRLSAACARALALRSPTHRTIKSMLKHGLDRQPLLPTGPQKPREAIAASDEHVRGAEYFSRDDTTIH